MVPIQETCLERNASRWVGFQDAYTFTPENIYNSRLKQENLASILTEQAQSPNAILRLTIDGSI